MNIIECPVCDTTIKVIQNTDRDTVKVDCPRCGRYEITDSALTMFERSQLKNKAKSTSFWLCNNQTPDDKYVYLDTITLRSVLSTFKTLKPKEQANRLLLKIGNMLESPEEGFDYPVNNFISVIGASNDFGVEYIFDYLAEEGMFINTIIHNADGEKCISGNITIRGWDRYDELKMSSKNSKLAFMAMKYGDDTLDKIFNDIIKKAVAETGFEIRKLDENKRAGLIDDKLRVEIRRSKFLIADLTHGNNGAYWEAGFAEGLGMPVIYTCKKKKFENEKSHFDTNHHLTVLWEDDEESLKQFAEELKATIRATLPAEAKMGN